MVSALSSSPELAVLDDPTLGLDAVAGQQDGLHAFAPDGLESRDEIAVVVEQTMERIGTSEINDMNDVTAADAAARVVAADGERPVSVPTTTLVATGSDVAFVEVDGALPADEPLQALTLECWVRPWRVAACLRGSWWAP